MEPLHGKHSILLTTYLPTSFHYWQHNTTITCQFQVFGEMVPGGAGKLLSRLGVGIYIFIYGWISRQKKIHPSVSEVKLDDGCPESE